MSSKKTKSKANPARKARSVVGRLKTLIGRGAQPKAAQAKKRQPKAVIPSKSSKDSAAKHSAPKSQVPPPNGKRKPPSITITRPEVTRPPLVPMPVPKNEPPAGAPNLLLPKGGFAVASLTPILRWMYVGGATRYEVEWSSDNHFGRSHTHSLVSEQTLVVLGAAHALKPGALYLWRVRGGNDSGWGPWSGPESFKVPDPT